MTTPEGRVKDRCKEILRRYKVWYYMPVQTGMGVAGIPDFVCCLPDGHFLAVETKAPGKLNNVSPSQKRQIDLIRKAKGFALVIDDPECLADFLKIRYENLPAASSDCTEGS